MDAIRFDRLTRRLVLAGLGSGSVAALLGFDEAESKRKKKKKPSKRKRCRKQKRTFCAGRCCPRGQRCENAACVESCSPVTDCINTGSLCGKRVIDDCVCRGSASRASACVGEPSAPCAALTMCSATDPCPAGQVCAICQCPGEDPDFRCYLPCPS